MTTIPVRTIACLCIALLCCATIGLAETYTFNGNVSNLWRDPDNWRPAGGPPTAADKAIIPNAELCIIAEEDAVADEVEVQSGGTLRIHDQDLTISSGAKLTVNGTLQFKCSCVGIVEIPHLRYKQGDLTVGGSGVITAADPDYGPGTITNASSASGSLKFTNSLMDVLGSITIDVEGNLQVDCEFRVVDPDDTMQIGSLTGSGEQGFIHGAATGTFKALGGTIKIGRLAFAGGEPAWLGTIIVLNNNGDEGTFQLTDMVPIQISRGPIHVRAGTLDIDRGWISLAGLEFTGGTIRIAQGKAILIQDAN